MPKSKIKVPKRHVHWKGKIINIHILWSNQDVDVNIRAITLIVFQLTDAN